MWSRLRRQQRVDPDAASADLLRSDPRTADRELRRHSAIERASVSPATDEIWTMWPLLPPASEAYRARREERAAQVHRHDGVELLRRRVGHRRQSAARCAQDASGGHQDVHLVEGLERACRHRLHIALGRDVQIQCQNWIAGRRLLDRLYQRCQPLAITSTGRAACPFAQGGAVARRSLHRRRYHALALALSRQSAIRLLPFFHSRRSHQPPPAARIRPMLPPHRAVPFRPDRFAPAREAWGSTSSADAVVDGFRTSFRGSVSTDAVTGLQSSHPAFPAATSPERCASA